MDLVGSKYIYTYMYIYIRRPTLLRTLSLGACMYVQIKYLLHYTDTGNVSSSSPTRTKGRHFHSMT
jgi:hypothetical protein